MLHYSDKLLTHNVIIVFIGQQLKKRKEINSSIINIFKRCTNIEIGNYNCNNYKGLVCHYCCNLLITTVAIFEERIFKVGRS